MNKPAGKWTKADDACIFFPAWFFMAERKHEYFIAARQGQLGNNYSLRYFSSVVFKFALYRNAYV
ncbi:hypothetical protein BUE76_22640 [Cnuella takakiae]|nr:hypothetical protein BUE76_22640 [Cnuella takakiae]